MLGETYTYVSVTVWFRMNHVTRLLLAVAMVALGIATSGCLAGLDSLLRTFMPTHEAS